MSFQSEITLQIICVFTNGILALLILYVVWRSALQINTVERSSVIIITFETISNLAILIMYLLILHMFWRKESACLRVIEGTRLYHVSPVGIRWMKRLTYFGLILSSAYLGTTAIFLMRDESHYLSLPELSYRNCKNAGVIHEGGIVTLVVALLTIYSSFSLAFTELIIPVLSVALYQVGTEFQRQMKQVAESKVLCRQTSFEDVGLRDAMQRYRKLKRTIDDIRITFGSQMLAYYISSVSYYAEVPHVWLGKRGDAEKALLAYYLVCGLLSIVPADFHHNVIKIN